MEVDGNRISYTVLLGNSVRIGHCGVMDQTEMSFDAISHIQSAEPNALSQISFFHGPRFRYQ